MNWYHAFKAVFVLHDTEWTYYSWEVRFNEVIKMPWMLTDYSLWPCLINEHSWIWNSLFTNYTMFLRKWQKGWFLFPDLVPKHHNPETRHFSVHAESKNAGDTWKLIRTVCGRSFCLQWGQGRRLHGGSVPPHTNTFNITFFVNLPTALFLASVFT